MTVNHDAVAALPITGSASKTLVRNVFVARMPYVLADAEDSRNLVATDPSTGAIIVDMLLLGRVFHYDPTDTTTAHDGTSCLVSADGLRYKLAVGTDVFAYAVLDNTISAPPGSPTLGDAYLVAAGATGAWAGKSNYIAVKTNRGWEFVNFSIGRFIYVESVDTYYHKNAGGAWVTGFGNQVTTPNSVPLSAAINFGKRLIVENQTTTSPPGSPTVGTAYIIGAGATGGWSGQDNKIAICEVAGSFVIYTPTNGWEAYDKSLNATYTYSGTAWTSSNGAFARHVSVYTQDTTGTTTAGSGTYAYSNTSAPVATTQKLTDGSTLSYTAKSAAANLFFEYSASMVSNSAGQHVIALFKDSIATAIAWDPVFLGGVNSVVRVRFKVAAGDASSHTYTIAAMYGSFAPSSLAHRLFEITEEAV